MSMSSKGLVLKKGSQNREQKLGTVSVRTGTQQIPREDNAAEDSCKLNENEEVMQECRKVKSAKGSTTQSGLNTR